MPEQFKADVIFPHTGVGPVRPCPLCGSGDNRIAVFEDGIEHRFDMPVLPVSDYGQARCHQCGLLYINAPLDDSYLADLYSRENVSWQKQYLSEQTKAWNNVTTEEEHRRFASVVDLTARFRDLRGVKWLDFGCQTGELGEICRARHSVQMYGVDVSEDYAAHADDRWGGHKTVRTSLADFVGEGMKFDVISAMETLEHIATPWETVATFRTLLLPGGLLIVSVPSAQYFRLKYHVFKTFRRLFNNRSLRGRASNTGRSIFGLCHTHPYNFSPESLTLLLKRGGFSTIHVGGMGWSDRFWYFAMIAHLISLISGGRIQLYPSVVAVARVSE